MPLSDDAVSGQPGREDGDDHDDQRQLGHACASGGNHGVTPLVDVGGRCAATLARHRGRLRRAAAIGALVLAAIFVLVYRQVLAISERPSWPPPPGAVTSARAELATRAFLERDGARPRDAALDFAWSTADTIEPLVEGAEFFPRIFDDVRAAHSSVHILMFGWREGDVGTDMATLLRQKLSEGVEVRVIVDAYGSRPYGEAREMFTGLAAAGAQIVINDVFPIDRDGLYPDDQHIDWRQDEVGRADHRKLYVIDGAVAWTGGAGIEDHFEDGGFHDIMVRVTGDVVRQAQAAFLTSFHGHGGPVPQDLDALFPTPGDPGTTRIALAQVIPGGFVAATQALREQIDGARERLDVMNAYLTDEDMVQRIAAAGRRGVRVRVVVSATSNNAPASAAFRHHYGMLIDAGVEIWELPGTVVHAKVIVADDVVSFGTVNLDSWALYRNSEVMMITRSVGSRRTRRSSPVRARHRTIDSRCAAIRSRPRTELGLAQAVVLPLKMRHAGPPEPAWLPPPTYSAAITASAVASAAQCGASSSFTDFVSTVCVVLVAVTRR